MMAQHKKSGFTLLEVLLALAVIAIALTALLKAISQNVENARRIKEKTISHWIATQGVAMIQLNLLQVNQDTTQDTTMLNIHWYWRARVSSTPYKNVQKITISVSTNKTGPFVEELQAFRFVS